jgi:hypothetical protein
MRESTSSESAFLAEISYKKNTFDLYFRQLIRMRVSCQHKVNPSRGECC